MVSDPTQTTDLDPSRFVSRFDPEVETGREQATADIDAHRTIVGHLYIALGMLAARHGMNAETPAIQHIKAALKELEHG